MSTQEKLAESGTPIDCPEGLNPTGWCAALVAQSTNDGERKGTKAPAQLVLENLPDIEAELRAVHEAIAAGRPWKAVRWSVACAAYVKALDDERCQRARERIALLPKEQRREAMRRASRSYSVPETCLKYDGCTRDGNEIVWPGGGERWPTRVS